MKDRFKTIIVGGGASGLFAACALINRGERDFIIIEKLDRVGKKLLVTGNGRGNISNEQISENNYHGENPSFVRNALNKYGSSEIKSFFGSLGVLTVNEKGRIYPLSRQASSLTDVLRKTVEDNGITILTDSKISKIDKKSCFVIDSTKGKFFAENVILACGGKSGKGYGTDGTAYSLAEKFGHTVTKCVPSLVQLRADLNGMKNLKGVKVNAEVKLLENNKEIKRATGDILFTDYGVSGDSIFFLSAYAADLTLPQLIIDFLPEAETDKIIEATFNKNKNFKSITLGELFVGIVNKQVGYAVVKRFGKNINDIVKTSEIAPLCGILKNFRLNVLGTLGFEYSQVTRGGIRTSDINDNTMESKLSENLFIIGEMLDIDGDCGGYNLQWAFSSANAAADAICMER